jgi:hypothetical protein
MGALILGLPQPQEGEEGGKQRPARARARGEEKSQATAHTRCEGGSASACLFARPMLQALLHFYLFIYFRFCFLL